jgi:polar amino acid transport system permease protein
MAYEWNFGIVFHYLPDLLTGIVNTLQLLLFVLCLSVPLGFVLGILRQARVPVLSWLAVAYIDLFRSSIALVLICWFYYAGPIALHVALSPALAVTLALGLQSAAFMAELLRAGIESTAPGQWEAARALGMPRLTIMRDVILPQALRRMVPLFFTQLIEILKNTALAGVVAYPELFYNALNIASTTYRPIETMTIVGASYFVVLFLLSRLSLALERRLGRSLERA